MGKVLLEISNVYLPPFFNIKTIYIRRLSTLIAKVKLNAFFQINRSPSFGTDEKLDHDVKFGVILDSIRLLNIK